VAIVTGFGKDFFSLGRKKLSFFVIMLEDLKLRQIYHGFIYLAESRRNLPVLKSHRHIELELNLVTHGTITYIISGNRYIFPRGSMLWIFPTQEHQLIDRSEDARWYVTVFKPQLIERACRGEKYAGLKSGLSIENATGEGVLSKLLQLETYNRLTLIMDSLMEDALDPDILNREAGFGVQSDFRFEHGDPDALNAGLRYLLVLAWKAFITGQAGASAIQLHPSIRRALTLLNRDGLDLGLTEIARQSGISVTYLSRLFRKQVGVPLNHYRNAVRLRVFMDYYRSPEKRTILESVYAAGFGSYAQFYKVFLRAYGSGPREYLNAHRSDGSE